MLKQLSEEEFLKRTRGGARTPVFREFLADRETPVSVLTRVAESDEAVFLLESVEGGETRGRVDMEDGREAISDFANARAGEVAQGDHGGGHREGLLQGILN